MWNIGSTQSCTVSAVRPATPVQFTAFQKTVPWVETAPLGTPVVPEV